MVPVCGTVIALTLALIERADALQVRPTLPGDSVPDIRAMVDAIGQRPDSAWYRSFGVDALPAGATYTDPASGLTVCKVTDKDRAVPRASGSFTFAYENGPSQISSHWSDGVTMKHTIAVMDGSAGTLDLVDIAPPCDLSNWRPGPSGVSGDQDFSFANNPATPRVAYFIRGDSIHMYDTATDTEVRTRDFPVPGFGADVWFQSDGMDTVFVGLARGSPDSAVAFFRSDATVTRATTSVFNEPYLELNGVYTLLQTGGSTEYTQFVWNMRDDVIDTVHSGFNRPVFHAASLFNRWSAIDVNTGGITGYMNLQASSGSHTAHYTDSRGFCAASHDGNGWKQPDAREDEQFYVVSHWNDRAWNSCSGALGHTLVRLTGNVQKLLAHHYHDADGNNTYWQLGFAQQSVDGWWFCFASDQNALGSNPGTDLFCARLPLR